jgi:hypothetical protein
MVLRNEAMVMCNEAVVDPTNEAHLRTTVAFVGVGIISVGT